MKKITALLFTFISMLLALSGCSSEVVFTEKSYQPKENDITGIIVQVTDRELEICASKDNQIHVDYFDSEKEYLVFEVSENKEFIVKLTFNKDWTDFIGTKPAAEYRKIKMAIPVNLLAGLSASTTNENIRLSNLSFTEQIDLRVNGGNIMCECVNVGKSVKLTAKNGDITGTLIGGWDDFSISCKVKKGDCNLPKFKDGGKKTFSAECNNGDINIDFVK